MTGDSASTAAVNTVASVQKKKDALWHLPCMPSAEKVISYGTVIYCSN